MPDERPSAPRPPARIALALVAAAVLGALATGASLVVNNRGVCCDIPYFAGFPAPFYGGSGGFVSMPDRLWPAALAWTWLWWFGLVLATVLIVARGRRPGGWPFGVRAGVGLTLAAFVGVAFVVAAEGGVLIGAFAAPALTAVVIVGLVVGAAVAVGRLV